MAWASGRADGIESGFVSWVSMAPCEPRCRCGARYQTWKTPRNCNHKTLIAVNSTVGNAIALDLVVQSAGSATGLVGLQRIQGFTGGLLGDQGRFQL